MPSFTATRPVRMLAAAFAAGALVLTVSGCAARTSDAPSAAEHAVTMTGTGSADVTPDIARASLTITGTDPQSTAAAQDAAAVATAAVLEALTAAGVADADIATAAISTQPQYAYPSDGTPQLTGYQTAQTLTVTLRNLATAGSILDQVTAAGGNDVRVDAFTLDVSDPTAATDKARAAAVAQATTAAEQYAQLLGFTLGPVTGITETSSTPGPIAYAAPAASGKDEAATPVSPGTTQVTVTVTASWAIDN